MSPRIVFMGSPDFSLPTLKALSDRYHVVGVVTQPDRPAGRGRELTPPPVQVLAGALGLPLIQPRRLRDPEAMQQLNDWAPEVIIVAAFGQILRQPVLDLPRYGCINVHASLLPRWRGASPIQAAILHGDAETGVTIMRMDAGLDTGPILSQRTVSISPDDTGGSLGQRLAELGASLLVETLPGYLGGEIQPQPQPEAGASYAPLLKKEDGLLDFHFPAETLVRQVRAYQPWPGAYLIWEGKPLKVLHARSATISAQSAGATFVHEGLPAVACSVDALVLEEVQPASKRAMPGDVFLRGARNWGI